MEQEQYTPYSYKGNTVLIERYLILSEQQCDETEYDIFDIQLNPSVQREVNNISKGGYDNYKIYNELNREGLNSFEYYKNSTNKKIYLYSEIISERKTKILLCAIANQNSKLWVNGKCLSIYQNIKHYYFTIILSKGKNTIIFEQYSPKRDTIFSIQLRNYKFEISDDFRALSNLRHMFQIDPLILVCEPSYRPNELKYKFMYLNNDIEIRNDYQINIYDSNIGFIKSINAELGVTVKIDIDELRSLHPETLRYELITCIFKDKDNKDYTSNLYIILNNFITKSEEINDKLFLLGKKLSKSIYEHIIGRLCSAKDIFQNGDFSGYFWATLQNIDLLNQLELNTYIDDFYKTDGVHDLYIHSQLDDSFIKITANVPKNYDMNKSYPVFIALATFNEGCFSDYLPINELSESCLCFDVTGRGFTGGSYVGEASTLEILDWIKKNYKIDEDRIYILGESNGGHATYAITQNYPYLPASIYPLISYPQIETIKNIINIPTYQIVSPKDYVFKGREKEVKKKIFKYGNYHELFLEEMIHHSFLHYIANKSILNQMLNAKRNMFPRQIIFKTYRNRHLQSFWIKLHGIKKGNKFAMIKATIENKRRIKITMTGTSGVTVMLPHQIEKDYFDIIINGRLFHFENPDNNKIILNKNKIWETVDNSPSLDLRKGTGLLDVYLYNLRIIIPNNSSEIINKSAENFSKPISNGTDPKIFVNYPIYVQSNVPNHIFSHNLILFDNCFCNTYVKQFADKLLIKYDDTGYEYKDKRYTGEYVILQVVPNPYNNNHSMLIISTNNERLLSKNLFTRKVITPYYLNGIHPYWNNEALVFDGKKYYAIYELGSDIREIN